MKHNLNEAKALDALRAFRTERTPEQKAFDAFYEGRNAAGWWVDGGCLKRERPENPYSLPSVEQSRVAWQRGFRQVMAEERLNADTEWD
jgi:hypothetical protein